GGVTPPGGEGGWRCDSAARARLSSATLWAELFPMRDTVPCTSHAAPLAPPAPADRGTAAAAPPWPGGELPLPWSGSTVGAATTDRGRGAGAPPPREGRRMGLRFTVLASGSAGNASLIETGGFGLLLDAGLGPRQLGARLASVGASWQDIHGVLLTH